MLSTPADRATARPWTPAAPLSQPGLPSDLPYTGPHDAERDAGFTAVLEVAADLLDCPSTLLWVMEDGQMRLAAVRGLAPAAACASSQLCTIVDAANPLAVIADASDDPRLAGDILVAGPAGIRHFIATVLFGPSGELLGVLGAGSPHRRETCAATVATRIGPMATLATRVFGGNVLARCRQVAEAGFSAVIMADAHGAPIFATAAARDLLGPVATPGQALELLVPADLQLDPDAVANWLRAPAGSRDTARSLRELRIRDAFGELRTVQAARCAWHDGNARGIVLVLRDGNDTVPRREPRSGRRDSLTGLPNREALFATVDSLRGRGARLGVALLGLDNFRAVNEALGHVIGDTVLQVVASRLMAWLPADAHLARFGSDEFVILFPA